MSLDRATAALSSADMAQPIFGSFQGSDDNAAELGGPCVPEAAQHLLGFRILFLFFLFLYDEN